MREADISLLQHPLVELISDHKSLLIEFRVVLCAIRVNDRDPDNFRAYLILTVVCFRPNDF